MSDATCKTCPWCDYEDDEDGTSWCLCRKHAPKAASRNHKPAFWPVVDEHADWCGEHPDRQPRLECGVTTIVTSETFPTERDMRRIVDALEKMASRVMRVKS